MKIKMLQSGEGSEFGAFEKDDVLELTEATANKLIERGIAEAVTVKPKKEKGVENV